MQSAPLPDNESQRLAALRALGVLDSGPEAEFDALVRTASLVCGVPISLISLIDVERQWFKANVGLPGALETPRDVAFCAHAILGDALFEVPDALLDPRFADNPLVSGSPDIRFYAGAPVVLSDGHHVGTLCVIDRQARQLNDMQREVLRCLALAAAQALEGRRAVRLQAESAQAVVASEARFRALSDGSPLGVYHADAMGHCTYTNPRWQEIYGLSLQESLGTGWSKTLHPEDQAAVHEQWQRATEKNMDFNMEFRILHPSGKVRQVRSTARAMCGSDGAVEAYIGSVDDVTMRHAALLKLADSKERLRRLYEATPAMMHSINEQGRLVTVSDQWLAKLGYSRDEVIGRPSTDFLTPASRQRALDEALPAFLKKGHYDNFEVQMLTKSGEVVDVLLSAIQDRDPDGQMVQGLAVLEDITARNRSEQALALERQRLENILDGTQLATWEWDVDTGLLRLNQRWAQMLGYRPDELGTPCTDTWAAHTHPEDWKQIPRLLKWHVEGHSEKFETEVRMRHRDGHWIWVLDVGKVMAWGPGMRPQTVFGTRQDITVRKRQEEALRKSQDFLERSGWMAGVGGWEVDLLLGKVYWSPATCQIHGVDPDHQPTLEEAISFYAPEARIVVEQAVQRAIEASEDWDFELPLIRADGRKIWVRAIGSAERVDGQAVRLVGAFQDVTQRVNERLALQEAKERIALATESGGIGVWQWHIGSGKLSWDDKMFQLYGLARPENTATYEVWSRALHREDVAATELALQRSIDTGEAFNTEFRIYWPDGSLRHLRGSGRVHRDALGQAVSMVGVNWDITEPRTLAAALAEQRELLEVTLRSIGDAVITTDALGGITWLNPVATQMTGWAVDAAVGQPLEAVFHIVSEDSREPAINPVTICLSEGKVLGLGNQTLLISRSGREYGIEDSAAPIRNAQGQVLGVVLVFRDVTEQRRLSGEMIYRATHDALTELVNRREFESRLQRLLDKTGGNRGEHALLFIDLDQFKIVNDTCGHAAGDELLKQMSKLLQEAVRHRDTVARLGGDEFAVILEHCQPDQAQRVAQQVCDRMDDFRYLHGEHRFRVGASIGLVPLTPNFTTAAAAMQAADTSCYAAKEAGRNRVHAWYDSDEARLARDCQVQWTTRIEQALDDNLFELYAQRIDALGDRTEGLHAEVLLRMRGSDGGLIPPGSFLPAAERFHLASRIDRWVLRHSVAWLCSIPSLEMIENLSVNLSGQSVGDRSFHQWALQVLSEAGPDICSRLCLEITETAAVTHLADAQRFIDKLRALGVKTALDDFGAGASSFGYLKSMPVDYLKIDGQFVRDLLTDPLDEAAVRCFIDVAKIVKMKTVAEFVDNPEVLQRLRDMGADYAQGFLLHHPAPINELLNTHAALFERMG